MTFFSRADSYLDSLIDRLRGDLGVTSEEGREREREDERVIDAFNEANAVTGPAKVLDVDFNAKKNAVDHKCDKYEVVHQRKPKVVLRRGGTFTIDLTMNKEVDIKKEYILKLYFNFGNTPTVHRGTQGIITVMGKTMFDKSHEDWDARMVQNKGKTLILEVQIPSIAPVGSWTMATELKPKDTAADRSARQLLRLDTSIYILFNPWNKHDGTYMPDEEGRNEYVLNPVGKIWQGGYPARGRHWSFGQFDDVVLPACVLLMERSGLKHEARGDPIFVSRAISKMVNSNDGDNGVLIGDWSGDYSDGTSPSQWAGSIKIMEEYVRRGRPVKYGQCWVFAGVGAAVCRALGLPCRPVTNLNSAHDTDVSLTIDEYVDKKGDKITRASRSGINPTGLGDSIWNFHVWNDVWMDRPDLPPGYGGWQAIDATPQETSDGVFQCGPASHEAVRRGLMELKYDVPFVLAEVNADVVHWQEDEDAQDGFRKIFSNKNHVGRQLLTKKVGGVENGNYGDVDKEDCTNLYKPPEGTKAERVTLQMAARRSRNARHAFRFPSLAEDDVNFTIEDIDSISIGDDFSVTVKAESTSEVDRTVQIVMKAGSVYYTGAPANPITEAGGEFVLKPKQSKTLSLPVPYSQYYSKLVEHAMVKMVAHCRVVETSYAWMGDDCFEITKPSVLVKALHKAVVEQPLKIEFSFMNPLPETMTDCVLEVDGPGLSRPKTIPISDVAAKGEMKWTYTMVPHKVGEFVLIATFNSKQLVNLSGSSSITVAEA
ncbi:hemocyte protein-glutamine gamma-glutamyltransferase-like [Portunus trituberculatus]|uniref:hemocyte protein-glutamine gamma-glutamyltransferase-like n=1 Tax=Portunus trituberculatus TaxID=210409 RepID=UPI001E1CBE5B|nr:hemocyte protein-glutamine gamma-glutamyltransferase-like [Portunus trituberculatus]